MAVARTLVGQDDSTLEAGTSSPQEAKARELGLDPLFSPEQRPHTVAAFAAAPRFILLDFRCAAAADTITSLLHLRAQCTHAKPTEDCWCSSGRHCSNICLASMPEDRVCC